MNFGKKARILFALWGAVLLALGVVLGINLPRLLEGEDARRLGAFEEITSLIKNQFYEEVDSQKLYEAAIRGAVSSLEDPYARYYTEEEYAAQLKSDAGQFKGIGVLIYQLEGKTYISRVYEDSPAEKVGLREGDQLIAVRGESIEGLSMSEISALITKEPERPVAVTYERQGQQHTVEMLCEEIVSHRVHFSMIGDVGYIVIDEFTGDCAQGFDEALSAAKEQGATGLIIDLRGNPGGNLDTVVSVADRLLGEGKIITIRGRSEKEEVYESDEEKIDLPYCVLINGTSASASEVLAGAVQDHGAGAIVGEQSFGKGIVQTTYALERSSGRVKLTTASYYTPAGRNIHGVGITPDIQVSQDPKWQGMPFASIPQEEDMQLQAALNILKRGE
jgi:carboxyl-terminal processing protease